MKQESKIVNSKITLSHITLLDDIHKISEEQQNYPEQYNIVNIEANLNLVNLSSNDNLGICVKRQGYEDRRSKFKI